MPDKKCWLFALALMAMPLSCQSPESAKPGPAPKAPAAEVAAPQASPTPTPMGGSGGSQGKAYRISGNIDEAVQEGAVCDVSAPFTVPGTLKFEFKPSGPSKGNYTYSGPFNATGSGPYEIDASGKMLVSGTGCIMGKCTTYSHDWTAKPIDPASCDGKTRLAP